MPLSPGLLMEIPMLNPLLDTADLPAFDRIRPEHVQPAITALLQENRAAIAALAHAPSHWETVPAVLEELQDRLDRAWAPVAHLNAVMNSEAWREAYNQALPALSAYATELGQNEMLFRHYQALAEAPEFAQLDHARQQAIRHALRDFQLSGIALPAAEKKRFAEIAAELAELSARFADQVLDASQAWELLLPDASRLRGLPESALALLAALAEQKQHKGYRLTLDFPAYLAVMTHADDRALRETVYTAFVTRASDQGPQAGQFDNSPVMSALLHLRQEQAQLLGHDHYAALSLLPKMARDADEVDGFLRDLAARSRPGAEKDLAELRAFAATELQLTELMPWDVSYASEKLKEKKYAISQELLRPYFPAPTVLAGMLAIASQLYGISFHERRDVACWHEDVRYYEIHENGAVIAGFYLDLYARAHKRGGAWMADCRVRRRRADGSLQLPVAFLSCNFNPPLAGKPALLSHDEVTTLFHEFGHGLHHMLSRVEVAAVSGINGVAWDAVELPSQFFENWCWEPVALAKISAHVETGTALPPELLEKMLAARNFQSGLMMLRQLEFALFDMAVHRLKQTDSAAIQACLDDVRQQVAVIKPPAFNRFQHSFSHIFAGGYAAGYYSYKWAEVLSADAFSRFEEEGVMNAATGRAFRDSVLAQGGSRDALSLFTEFRGRAPTVDALLRHSGL